MSTTARTTPAQSDMESRLSSILYVSETFDPATRLPLVVLDSTAFPVDQALQQDLLPRIVDRLPQMDYTLLFFACGLPSKPSVKLVAKCYAMLKRSARKRVKKVYVVHESWWVRAITEMLHGIVSPKFRRKVLHVSTLSQLAQQVDITRINIPPAVYLHDLKVESSITIPRHHTPVFAMPIGSDGSHPAVPRFFDDALEYLGRAARQQRDVFKSCDDKSLVYVLRECFDRGQYVSLDDYDARVVAAVLKLYLYQLPLPVLPVSSIPLPIHDTAEYCQKVFAALPAQNRLLLTKICDIMHDLTLAADWNSPGYLSGCVAPSLVALSSSSKDGIAIGIRFFKNLLTFWPSVRDVSPGAGDSLPSDLPVHKQRYRNLSTPELRGSTTANSSKEEVPPPLPQRAASTEGSLATEAPQMPPRPAPAPIVRQVVELGSGNETSETDSNASTSPLRKPPPPPARGTRRTASDADSSTVLRITTKANLLPVGQRNYGITKSPTKARAPSPPPSPRRFGPRSKCVSSTRRGKMVSELARLYEERCATAQVLVEIGHHDKDTTQ